MTQTVVFQFKATSFQGNQFMNFFGLRVKLHCKNSPSHSILSILILVTVGENIIIIIITLSKTFFLYYRFCTFVKLLPKYIIYVCVRHMFRSSIHTFEPCLIFYKTFYKTILYQICRSCINFIERSTCRISINNYFVSMQIIFMFLKKTMANSFCTQYFGKKSGFVTQVRIEVCRDDAFSVITGREFRS